LNGLKAGRNWLPGGSDAGWGSSVARRPLLAGEITVDKRATKEGDFQDDISNLKRNKKKKPIEYSA
jgi:hypothetical protein